MTTDVTRYVNLRYGVDNEGNTVIGPQRPNASVNPAPDTKGGQHFGYFTGNDIRGFSQIHASGTGYGKYGQFLLSDRAGHQAGQNLYYLTSPRYDEMVIAMPGGKEIVIRANNLSRENKYIQSVRINGQEWHSTMFTHEMIRDGAVFEFDMGSTAVDYTQVK